MSQARCLCYTSAIEQHGIILEFDFGRIPFEVALLTYPTTDSIKNVLSSRLRFSPEADALAILNAAFELRSLVFLFRFFSISAVWVLISESWHTLLY